MRSFAQVAMLVVVGCSAKGDIGERGPQGEPGPPGQGVIVAALAEGADANCPSGGTKITAGASVSYVCSGAPGGQGPVGGPTVRSADGSSLGTSYGYQALHWLSGAAVPATPSPATADGYVLLLEEPGGQPANRTFVWRNLLDGSALGCVSSAPGIYYADPFCVGAAYGEPDKLPPAGVACAALVGGEVHLLAVQPGALTRLSVQSVRSGGTCQNQQAQLAVAVPVVDRGVVSRPAGPLRLEVP